MLSFSPVKLLIVGMVALIVLGPDKLPGVARQIGATWHALRQWRAKMEDELRGSFPNLPPTTELVGAVRSPISFLERLADQHEQEIKGTDQTSIAAPVAEAPAQDEPRSPDPSAGEVIASGARWAGAGTGDRPPRSSPTEPRSNQAMGDKSLVAFAQGSYPGDPSMN